MGRRRHNCYALLEEREGRAGLMLNAGSLFSPFLRQCLCFSRKRDSGIRYSRHIYDEKKKKVVAAGSIVKEMAK